MSEIIKSFLKIFDPKLLAIPNHKVLINEWLEYSNVCNFSEVERVFQNLCTKIISSENFLFSKIPFILLILTKNH